MSALSRKLDQCRPVAHSECFAVLPSNWLGWKLPGSGVPFACASPCSGSNHNDTVVHQDSLEAPCRCSVAAWHGTFLKSRRTDLFAPLVVPIPASGLQGSCSHGHPQASWSCRTVVVWNPCITHRKCFGKTSGTQPTASGSPSWAVV